MKTSIKTLLFLLLVNCCFTSCEFIEHGKEAFLGDYSITINYDSSVVEIAPDFNADGDNNINTKPPTAYVKLDSANKALFIDTYFTSGLAHITDIGGDSIKYTDNKRTLFGCVKGDSVFFKPSDLGESPVITGVVVESTVLTANGKTQSNDVYIDFSFYGTGSVTDSTGTTNGIVRGKVKIVARQ
ncbi:MAG: hypothetical protein JXQ69_08480 [Paludibacteraceae bacterium]|nr:hypothetical protein [Paludibacteraceae bacterium]MBN2788342.1 hypothetical protein [Paludibacteraceae bacterium]